MSTDEAERAAEEYFRTRYPDPENTWWYKNHLETFLAGYAAGREEMYQLCLAFHSQVHAMPTRASAKLPPAPGEEGEGEDK